MERETAGVGAITGVSRIKFVLKYTKRGKKERMLGTRESGEGGSDPAWRRKESRREPPALFPAITRPRNPEDVIISPVFLVREFERRQRRARRIYFIKTIFQPSPSLLVAEKLSLSSEEDNHFLGPDP